MPVGVIQVGAASRFPVNYQTVDPMTSEGERHDADNAQPAYGERSHADFRIDRVTCDGYGPPT